MLPAPALPGTTAKPAFSCAALQFGTVAAPAWPAARAIATAPSRVRSTTESASQVVSEFSVRELVAARGGDSLDLWARTINPQFARVLKTIGFDRTWQRAEGAYLWDSKGVRYLDLLGGFGVFNVGRNNPRVRDGLV